MPIKIQSPKKSRRTDNGTTEVVQKVKQYDKLKDEHTELTKKVERLKEQLKTHVENKGYDTPQGHKVVSVGGFILKNTLRVTPVLKPSAIDVIKSKIPSEAKRLIETVEIVREDRLKELIEQGVINTRIAKQLYSTKENYAFSIKEETDEQDD